jgi:hypothetical protein
VEEAVFVSSETSADGVAGATVYSTRLWPFRCAEKAPSPKRGRTSFLFSKEKDKGYHNYWNGTGSFAYFVQNGNAFLKA